MSVHYPKVWLSSLMCYELQYITVLLKYNKPQIVNVKIIANNHSFGIILTQVCHITYIKRKFPQYVASVKFYLHFQPQQFVFK